MTDADNTKYTLAEGWVIATDPDDLGRAEEWFRQVRDGAEPTVVPSIIQQTFPDYHGVAWYWNRFTPRLKKATRTALFSSSAARTTRPTCGWTANTSAALKAAKRRLPLM